MKYIRKKGKSAFGDVKNINKKLSLLPDKFTFEEAYKTLTKYSITETPKQRIRNQITRMIKANKLQNVGNDGRGGAIYEKI